MFHGKRQLTRAKNNQRWKDHVQFGKTVCRVAIGFIVWEHQQVSECSFAVWITIAVLDSIRGPVCVSFPLPSWQQYNYHLMSCTQPVHCFKLLLCHSQASPTLYARAELQADHGGFPGNKLFSTVVVQSCTPRTDHCSDNTVTTCKIFLCQSD